jgi:hypothetical protein
MTVPTKRLLASPVLLLSGALTQGEGGITAAGTGEEGECS